MLSDRDRLHRRAATPRYVALAQALGRLRSSLTVMNTGAHPDDEQNGLLAALRFDQGMRVVVACSTRGEGGQNTLGPERIGALGLLRSREMEQSARVIDADVAWLGHGPEDPVHDFGFSKSGVDTLERWGKDRILERLVRAYRTYRPDVVIPTFLDVPGQHGHHRAMTEAAETTLAMAADPSAFPEHAAEGLLPWKVAKYYLPAWSGGGDTYDDEVPPPPATTEVTAPMPDPVTGASYERIGQMSRAYHASQNMGHWHAKPRSSWVLHLKGFTGGEGFTDGLPTRLADLAPLPELTAADTHIAEALRAFPQPEALIAALTAARKAIFAAQAQLTPSQSASHGHRLARKLTEIDAALLLAAGFDLSLALASSMVKPGEAAELILDHYPGLANDISVQPVSDDILTPQDAVPLTEPRQVLRLQTRPEAVPRNNFRPDWSPLGGNGPGAVRIRAKINGCEVSALYDAEEMLDLIPAAKVSLDPEAILIRLPHATAKVAAPPVAAAGGAALSNPSDDAQPDALKPDHFDRSDFWQISCRADASVSLQAPEGLSIEETRSGFELRANSALTAGRYSLPVEVAGQPALQASPIAYPHIGRTRHLRPVTLEVLALDLQLPGTKVGLIDGGADRVGLWLARMGVDVTLLDAEALSGDLSSYDTIVVGIFAYGTRPDLAQANPRIKDWVRAGGHLVTLYHRPGDGWRGQETPPLPLTIGAPSLRWRVTNPKAPVTLLAPDHPLLAGPNRISAADFDGWDKERGLYFAASWDAAYVPLLSMSDAGEAPLLGALLSAPVGKGRHTHSALVLHHQIDRMVPGALRLLANLLQKA